jgi:hypothetical protein
LTYPSSSSAEERAVRWLVEDDLGTAVDDEQSLRQRFVLSTLWFLQTTTTTSFGTRNHAASWTTNLDECEWFDVECDGNGWVTDLWLYSINAQGQIPHDLGLLTSLTNLSLWGNQLTGTIPSSLVALKSLSALSLHNNRLVGTMPFCNSDHSVADLLADCMEVICTCCTQCCPVEFGNIPAYAFCDK